MPPGCPNPPLPLWMNSSISSPVFSSKRKTLFVRLLPTNRSAKATGTAPGATQTKASVEIANLSAHRLMLFSLSRQEWFLAWKLQERRGPVSRPYTDARLMDCFGHADGARCSMIAVPHSNLPPATQEDQVCQPDLRAAPGLMWNADRVVDGQSVHLCFSCVGHPRARIRRWLWSWNQ